MQKLALVRGIPSSFANCVTSKQHDGISVQRAVEQHKNYVQTLESIVEGVFDLPTDEDHPDSVFIEDTVIVIGKTAVLMSPGHVTRRNEVQAVKDFIKANQQKLGIEELRELGEYSVCDGGDILWTGRHLFVGISERTTIQAADDLEKALPGVTVVPVHVPFGTLHLKTIVTAIDPQTLIIHDQFESRLRQLLSEDLLASYHLVAVPDLTFSNVLAFPDLKTVVVASGFPASEAILRQHLEPNDWKIHVVDNSEISKADGALTCCSILVGIW